VTITQTELISMLIYLAVVLVALLLHFSFFGKMFKSQRRALARLRNLSSDKPEEETASTLEFFRGTLRKLGSVLMPQEEDHRVAELKGDFLRSGIYGPNALRVYMGAKLVLMVLLPIPFAVVPYSLGLISLLHAVTASLLATCLGMLLPKAWLRHHVKSRQRVLREALPDAIDMLVLCLEGGISLTAAIVRLTSELRGVHPELAAEMNIIYREVQLGLTVGQALQSFADRCALEEVGDLASVLLQSERIGASVVQALRIHAETSRNDRQQRAEEMAHKAAVKILFPTLLCIFPAVFIVLLGPAALQISNLFSK
jgi:tight adherence protein C